MPDILERLRKMEIEILSRLTIGAGEHVGSIKIVKGQGKGKGMEIRTRDLASLFIGGRSFDPMEKTEEGAEGEKDELEYDTDEEEVMKMMEGAGSGKGTEFTTYRTARWEEPKESVMSLFANPPSQASEYRYTSPEEDTIEAESICEIGVQPRIPGRYPSAMIREEPTTSSSIMTVKAVHQPLITASAIHIPEESASMITQEPAQTRSEIPTHLEEVPEVVAAATSNDALLDVEETQKAEGSKLPATHRYVHAPSLSIIVMPLIGLLLSFTMIGKTFKQPVFKKQSGE